jgi:hypothetical protein
VIVAGAPGDEGAIRGRAATQGCAKRARPWLLAAAILGSSIAFIDGSFVTVAPPPSRHPARRRAMKGRSAPGQGSPPSPRLRALAQRWRSLLQFPTGVWVDPCG